MLPDPDPYSVTVRHGETGSVFTVIRSDGDEHYEIASYRRREEAEAVAERLRLEYVAGA